MRVLRISLTYPTDQKNGIGLHAFHLSQYSKVQTLIITKKQFGIPWKSIDQVEIFRIRLNSVGFKKEKSILLNFFPFVSFIFSQLKFFIYGIKKAIKFNPDIVQCHSPHGLLYALFFKIFFKKKIVLSFHGSDLNRLKNYPFILKNLLNVFDLIIVVDKNMIDTLTDVSNRISVFHAPGGCEYDFFRFEKENYSGNQFIAVGNVRWQKDYQTMVEGFQLFNKKNQNKFILKIIGDYHPNDETVNNNKYDKIIFIGNRNKDFVKFELNNSVALIMSSISEGLPKVIIEAMSCGLPVITTNVGSCGLLVDNEKKGIIIEETKSPKALANALQKFIDNRNLYDKIFIRESVKNYSWDHLRNKLNLKYNELIKK